MLGRKVLRIADVAWPLFLGQNMVLTRVIDGLPDDARAIDSTHDGRTTTITFESESFEPTEEGKPYPEIDIEFLTIESDDRGGG